MKQQDKQLVELTYRRELAAAAGKKIFTNDDKLKAIKGQLRSMSVTNEEGI